jgi:hypothetical protein
MGINFIVLSEMGINFIVISEMGINFIVISEKIQIKLTISC